LVYQAKEDYDKAITDFNKAIELDPACFEAFNNRGLCYADKELFDLAIVDLTKAITFNKRLDLEINSKSAESYLLRALIYCDLKQFDLAKNDLNLAVNLSTNQLTTKYALQLLDAFKK
jgi:tetratricopeptide (TPR) repeat protein